MKKNKESSERLEAITKENEQITVKKMQLFFLIQYLDCSPLILSFFFLCIERVKCPNPKITGRSCRIQEFSR